MNIISFLSSDPLLNSNFFIALTTLCVGGFAIFLYLKQKKDYKKDAAKLILQEIRYAEQQIRSARNININYYLADKLLPTNSWHKNIHLFIKDLKETEIDLISRFYSNAAYLDVVISKISDKKSKLLIPVEFSKKNESQELEEKKQLFGKEQNQEKEKFCNGQKQIFEFNVNKILEEVSQKIEFLYNTPAVSKLRFISEKKWYQLF